MIHPRSTPSVLQRTRENIFRKWSLVAGNPNTAAARLVEQDFFPVHCRPSFQMSRQSQVFTMGSCFARNIEYIFDRLGVPVLTARFSVPSSCYLNANREADSGAPHRGLLNKFNPHSMLMELQRALTDYPLQDEGLIEVSPGVWFDPQSTNTKPGDYAAVADLRHQVREVTSRVRQADVVFLTLGMTETWYDSVSGLSLNNAPPTAYFKAMPGRFQFKNATSGEVVESLRSMFTLLQLHGKPGVRIVITVSPVPLGLTFTGYDVVEANAYSKATLLSAARQVAAEFENVDYFPSYEMVVHTPVEKAYKEDRLHVRSELVEFVINRFCDAYLKD